MKDVITAHSPINSILDLYEAVLNNREDAKNLIFARTFFLSVCEYDPRYVVTPYSDIKEISAKIIKTNSTFQDYIDPILLHSQDEIKVIILDMRDKIKRNYELMPVHKIRTFDSNCMRWLSRKEGDSLKAKLALNRNILGVKKSIVFDSVENRLFKHYLKQLSDILEKRNLIDLFEKDKEKNDILLSKIKAWLRTDEANSISALGIFAPNNVLLSDRRYRKIYDSWVSLKNLNKVIENDIKNLEENFLKMLFWTFVSKLSKYENIRIAQNPIGLNFDEFKLDYIDENTKFFAVIYDENEIFKLEIIKREKSIEFIYKKADNQKIIEEYLDFASLQAEGLGFDIKNINDFVDRYIADYISSSLKLPSYEVQETSLNSSAYILDIFSSKINYSFAGKKYLSKNYNLVQSWDFSKVKRIIDCSENALISLGGNVKNFSMYSLFNSQLDISNKDRLDAAKILLDKAGLPAKAEDCIYPIPDSLDEMSSFGIDKILANNFASKTAVPLSIAAIFAKLHLGDFNAKKAIIKFVLSFENEAFVLTPIKLDYDKNRELKMPKTKGYSFIKYPSKIVVSIEDIFKECPLDILDRVKDIFTLYDIASMPSSVAFFDRDKDDLYKINKDKLLEELFSFLDIEKTVGSLIDEYNEMYKFKLDPNILDIYDVTIDTSALLYKGFEQGTLLNGLSLYAECMQAYPKEALWEIYMPRLQIYAGDYVDIIAKDKTLAISTSKTHIINISKIITLKKNNTKISFPLIQLDNKARKEYEVVINPKDLPLSKDVDCKVSLEYTYGDSTPYKLYFESKCGKYKFNSTISERVYDKNTMLVPFLTYQKIVKPIDINKEILRFRNNVNTLNLNGINEDMLREEKGNLHYKKFISSREIQLSMYKKSFDYFERISPTKSIDLTKNIYLIVEFIKKENIVYNNILILSNSKKELIVYMRQWIRRLLVSYFESNALTAEESVTNEMKSVLEFSIKSKFAEFFETDLKFFYSIIFNKNVDVLYLLNRLNLRLEKKDLYLFIDFYSIIIYKIIVRNRVDVWGFFRNIILDNVEFLDLLILLLNRSIDKNDFFFKFMSISDMKFLLDNIELKIESTNNFYRLDKYINVTLLILRQRQSSNDEMSDLLMPNSKSIIDLILIFNKKRKHIDNKGNRKKQELKDKIDLLLAYLRGYDIESTIAVKEEEYQK